jgi:hypothetical protein
MLIKALRTHYVKCVSALHTDTPSAHTCAAVVLVGEDCLCTPVVAV